MKVDTLPPTWRAKISITPDSECWLWTGWRHQDGYGMAYRPGTRCRLMAHRAIYTWLVGEIPVGLQIDHLCRVRSCVNPDHLEPVTSRTNTLRGFSPQAINARKTHCPAGHEYDLLNTITNSDGSRKCRICHNRVQGEWRRRRKAVAPAGA